MQETSIGTAGIAGGDVSTDDQSCERQERDLRALAARAGYDIVGVFMEKASGARSDRQERKKVMALALGCQSDAVLVTELSRWGRSTKDLLETPDELHDRGVSVLPLNGRSFDLNSANGRLKAKKVLAMHRDGLSNRLIGRNIGLSKNTVMEIVRRAAA